MPKDTSATTQTNQLQLINPNHLINETKSIIQKSVKNILTIKEIFYLNEQQTIISEDLKKLADFLQHTQKHKKPFKQRMVKSLRFLLSLDANYSNHKNSAKDTVLNFQTQLKQHLQALLLENAQIQQDITQIEKISQTMQHLQAQFVDVLSSKFQNTTSFTQAEKKQLLQQQSALLQQLTTVNNSIMSLSLIIEKNKEVIHKLNLATQNSISAQQVYKLVNQL